MGYRFSFTWTKHKVASKIMNKIIRICTVVMSVLMSIVFTTMTLPRHRCGTIDAQGNQTEGRWTEKTECVFQQFFRSLRRTFPPEHTDRSHIDQVWHGTQLRKPRQTVWENPKTVRSRIRASYIDESAKKYFGRNIAKHQTSGEYQYRNGFYHIVNASGEMRKQFSQATRVVDLGGNRYAVDINVYSASSGWSAACTEHHNREEVWRGNSRTFARNEGHRHQNYGGGWQKPSTYCSNIWNT